MKKVFVGGSRAISRLGRPVLERLDKMIEGKLPILVGDASGADKAVQKYLLSREYDKVEIFCSGSACRNNVGHWSTRHVTTTHDRGFDFYAEKDRAMAREATFGFMIWDGNSIGTLLNVLRLLLQNKQVVLYFATDKKFSELRSYDQWLDLIKELDVNLRAKVEHRATLEDRSTVKPSQASLFQ